MGPQDFLFSSGQLVVFIDIKIRSWQQCLQRLPAWRDSGQEASQGGLFGPLDQQPASKMGCPVKAQQIRQKLQVDGKWKSFSTEALHSIKVVGVCKRRA
jgi:hypothetical protein